MSNRLTKGIGLFGHLFTRKLRFDTNNADEVSAEGQISWNSSYSTFDGFRHLLTEDVKIPVRWVGSELLWVLMFNMSGSNFSPMQAHIRLTAETGSRTRSSYLLITILPAGTRWLNAVTCRMLDFQSNEVITGWYSSRNRVR